MKALSTGNIAKCAILAPIIVILLTIGWYQQTMNQLPNLNDNDKNKDSSFVIAGYFINWGIYDREFNVVDLQAEKLSHVLYAFANVNQDGTIVLGDPWADTDIKLSKDKTIDGVQDPWKEEDHDLHGNFKQLALLKNKYRHLKVSLSIGGYSWSSNFSMIAADPESRAKFTETALSHLQQLGLDGIDIDWEFPETKEDAKNYVLLLQEMRMALDQYQKEYYKKQDEPFLLSVAMPCGPQNYRLLQLREMAEYVDLFYLMAYDFAGEWESKTGHQSNLYGGSLSVDQAVTDYENAGVPSKKIVMGLPMYGRGFSDTKSKPGSSYHGVPDGSWDKGSFDYKDLPTEGSKEFLDKEKGASWSYNEDAREFVTYDTPAVAQLKSDYVKERQLGGVMFWELSADGNGERSLLEIVYQSLGSQLNSLYNHLSYPLSPYNNIPFF
ncbi:chitinase [Pilaira anomala]|nr:chitinase [Pilaira anomala]